MKLNNFLLIIFSVSYTGLIMSMEVAPRAKDPRSEKIRNAKNKNDKNSEKSFETMTEAEKNDVIKKSIEAQQNEMSKPAQAISEAGTKMNIPSLGILRPTESGSFYLGESWTATKDFFADRKIENESEPTTASPDNSKTLENLKNQKESLEKTLKILIETQNTVPKLTSYFDQNTKEIVSIKDEITSAKSELTNLQNQIQKLEKPQPKQSMASKIDNKLQRNQPQKEPVIKTERPSKNPKSTTVLNLNGTKTKTYEYQEQNLNTPRTITTVDKAKLETSADEISHKVITKADGKSATEIITEITKSYSKTKKETIINYIKNKEGLFERMSKIVIETTPDRSTTTINDFTNNKTTTITKESEATEVTVKEGEEEPITYTSDSKAAYGTFSNFKGKAQVNNFIDSLLQAVGMKDRAEIAAFKSVMKPWRPKMSQEQFKTWYQPCVDLIVSAPARLRNAFEKDEITEQDLKNFDKSINNLTENQLESILKKLNKQVELLEDTKKNLDENINKKEIETIDKKIGAINEKITSVNSELYLRGI